MLLLVFAPFVIKAFIIFWKPRSIWYRTAPPTPAASPADCPTECHFTPKETTQMDPATCGSIVFGKQATRLGMVGQAGREIVVAPAKHFRKREVQHCVPPWQNFLCLSSWWEMIAAVSKLGTWDSKQAKAWQKCLEKRNKEVLCCQKALVSFCFGFRALLLFMFSVCFGVNKYIHREGEQDQTGQVSCDLSAVRSYFLSQCGGGYYKPLLIVFNWF